MSQDQKTAPLHRRSALYGFAEHIWSVEETRWKLRPRPKPIASAFVGLAVLGYLSLAGFQYARNRWIRGVEDTSFREMLISVFPDPIYYTDIRWAPEFVATRVDAARKSHSQKIGAFMFARAKEAMEKQDWKNFFNYIFKASTLDPTNVEARLLSAQAFFSLRRDDDALDLLEEAIPLLPDKQDYAREYIRACFAKEKEGRVIAMAKYVLARPETAPAVREAFARAMAMAYYQRGDFARCAKVIETEKLQRTPDGFMLTVRMLRETGEQAEAVRMLEPVALAQSNDPTFLSALIELKKGVGDIEGARSSASLYLIRASDKYQARIKLIELLESPEQLARQAELIASYRRDFAGNEPASLLLCEYAADRGRVDLCAELMKEAKAKKYADAPRFELLFIESHLKANRYDETVSLVDKLFVDNPAWLLNYRQIFDCLRMVAQMSMSRDDMSEIGFRKLSERAETLPMPLMTTVAKKLVQVGRSDDAMRVINLAYERNARSHTALTNVVDVHLAAGGGPTTPALIRRLLENRRPSSELLALARSVVAGDAFLFESGRDKLIADLETLLAGKPILADVPAADPVAKAKARESK